MVKTFSLLCLVFPFLLNAQKISLTLEDAVRIAQDQSLKSKSVNYQFQSSQWSYKAFRRSYLPSFSLSGTLPEVNQTLDRVTQPDGTDQYKRRSQAAGDVRLGVSQKIGLTGGTLSLFSSLERIDILSDPTSTNWLSVPVSVGINQPLFKYNPMRWELKERPLLRDRAIQQYSENLEEVSQQTTNYFFELISAQKEEELASQTMLYNDTIFQLSKGRFKMGKIAENELLQVELAKLNSEIRFKQSKLRKEVSELRLKNYLGFGIDKEIEVLFQDSIPAIEINTQKALQMALQYNSELIQLEFNKLQGDKAVAQAKANKRVNMDVFAQYGLSQNTSQEVEKAYESPQDNQLLRVGFNIPIMRWGAGKSEYQAAVMSRNQIEADYQLALNNFQERVFERVGLFTIKNAEVSIAKKADEVAQKRYYIAQQRYLIGKITTTDLNIAARERDSARKDYILAVKDYWNGYYDVRKLTHYDFLNDKVIEYDKSEMP